VGLGELHLVPDEQGLERLLHRLLAVKSDCLPELDVGRRETVAGAQVNLGLGEPAGGEPVPPCQAASYSTTPYLLAG
jgi:hypothetical protein